MPSIIVLDTLSADGLALLDAAASAGITYEVATGLSGDALREALAIVLEEGLDARVARHAAMHRRLRAGLEALGIRYVPTHSLHTLNCIHIPAGADDATVRRRLLDDYGIEIGGGLGAMAGKAWRIGLMGHGATIRNVDLVLAALAEILRDTGPSVAGG